MLRLVRSSQFLKAERLRCLQACQLLRTTAKPGSALEGIVVLLGFNVALQNKDD